ncbi:SDR family oxidoreductase [Kineosporia succinea]|uniref:NADP-dependent 3-hydroxy acid dehydrogenase YdfG n=1 Tax=Kineosporia succinea TaxID=84632 RepID=A0ABT9PAC3_9ACTN|nr:SDR family oxidoreductase [Kineosporia succinea]MDP9829641.1 NADP-dependent 3-hydroxy acid dehydrogenase YdfG [Kineosporia succinea]
MTRVAVISGASSGIGAATARGLAAAGYEVVLLARREERLKELCDQIGPQARYHVLDVTDADAVTAFAGTVEQCDVLVNNAGGAVGADPVLSADPAAWRAMYEVNVIGPLQLTQALAPKMKHTDDAVIVVLTSTAADVLYEGGGGYTAAKHGEHALAGTLRLELCGEPVRVIEIQPGMVATPEFSLNRFGGDQAKADAVYAGVAEPLTAEDVADTIVWSITRPRHVNVDLMVLRPRAQAAQHKVHRVTQ